jgi:superfamily II DNA or RNA helicase
MNTSVDNEKTNLTPTEWFIAKHPELAGIELSGKNGRLNITKKYAYFEEFRNDFPHLKFNERNKVLYPSVDITLIQPMRNLSGNRVFVSQEKLMNFLFSEYPSLREITPSGTVYQYTTVKNHAINNKLERIGYNIYVSNSIQIRLDLAYHDTLDELLGRITNKKIMDLLFKEFPSLKEITPSGTIVRYITVVGHTINEKLVGIGYKINTRNSIEMRLDSAYVSDFNELLGKITNKDFMDLLFKEFPSLKEITPSGTKIQYHTVHNHAINEKLIEIGYTINYKNCIQLKLDIAYREALDILLRKKQQVKFGNNFKPLKKWLQEQAEKQGITSIDFMVFGHETISKGLMSPYFIKQVEETFKLVFSIEKKWGTKHLQGGFPIGTIDALRKLKDADGVPYYSGETEESIQAVEAFRKQLEELGSRSIAKKIRYYAITILLTTFGVSDEKAKQIKAMLNSGRVSLGSLMGAVREAYKGEVIPLSIREFETGEYISYWTNSGESPSAEEIEMLNLPLEGLTTYSDRIALVEELMKNRPGLHRIQAYCAVMYSLTGKFIDFSTTGSGKTRSALEAVVRANYKKVVYITPFNVALNIAKEYAEEYPEIKFIDIENKKTYNKTASKEMLILPWTKMVGCYTALIKKHLGTPDSLIIDEAHTGCGISEIKQEGEEKDGGKWLTNAKSLAQGIVRKNGGLLLLTATPYSKSYKDTKKLIEYLIPYSTDKALLGEGKSVGVVLSAHLKSMGGYQDFSKILKNKVKFDDETILDNIEAQYDKILECFFAGINIIVHSTLVNKDIQSKNYSKQLLSFKQGFLSYVKEKYKNEPEKLAMILADGVMGEYNGVNGKCDFTNVKILFCSTCINVGLNGLQFHFSTMLCLSVHTTAASYLQLRGRILRQGTNFSKISIYLPSQKSRDKIYENESKLKNLRDIEEADSLDINDEIKKKEARVVKEKAKEAKGKKQAPKICDLQGDITPVEMVNERRDTRFRDIVSRTPATLYKDYVASPELAREDSELHNRVSRVDAAKRLLKINDSDFIVNYGFNGRSITSNEITADINPHVAPDILIKSSDFTIPQADYVFAGYVFNIINTHHLPKVIASIMKNNTEIRFYDSLSSWLFDENKLNKIVSGLGLKMAEVAREDGYFYGTITA